VAKNMSREAMEKKVGRLSPRLEAILKAAADFSANSSAEGTIAKNAKKYRVLADIGTDHAYLPIEAIKRGICERAIACDVAEGPLKAAAKNVQAAALDIEDSAPNMNNAALDTREVALCEKIETRLGDGLRVLHPGEADCIVIAGMGGMNICEILASSPQIAKGELRQGNRENMLEHGNLNHKMLEGEAAQGCKKPPQLILQPQHGQEELRRFLHTNMYTIIEETLVQERERFYVIMVAQAVTDACIDECADVNANTDICTSVGTDNVDMYSEAEYFTGRFSPKKNPALLPYLHKQHEKISQFINNIPHPTEQSAVQTRLQWLHELIDRATGLICHDFRKL